MQKSVDASSNHVLLASTPIESRKTTYINWFDSIDQIPTALQESFPNDVEGAWWYQVLDNSDLNDQFVFKYGVVYLEDFDYPIAIVPAFVMNVPIDLVVPEFLAKILNALGGIIPSLKYQRTLFVGSPCSDECTIGILNNVELAEILPTIELGLQALARTLKVEMIVWKDIPTIYQSSLEQFSKVNNYFAMVSYPGTEVELSGKNFDDYLKVMKGSRRHNLKKKLRRSHEYGQLETSVVQNPDEKTLAEVFALFWQTYEKGKTKLERLNTKFFAAIAQQTVSRFVLLRDGRSGKLVAFMLCFALEGGKVINKFVGLDYSLDKNWYIYFRLWEAAVNWSYTIEAKKIQSGQTGYRAKIDVGHELTSLVNYCKHTQPIIHWIMTKVSKTIDWASLDSDLAVFLKAHPDESVGQDAVKTV